MPSGDEGTGLHAFDDLDPISTVSALNVMPESDAQPPQRGVPPRSAPPPPLPRPNALIAPLPGDGNGTSSGVRSAPPPAYRSLGGLSLPPPPARGGVAGRSVPPPPPPPRRDSQAPAGLSADALPEHQDEDTKVVPNAFAQDPDYAPTSAFARPGDGAFEDFDGSANSSEQAAGPSTLQGVAPSGQGAAIDDTELLELSATTVATNIDMDWDEEEVQTKLREGAEGEPAPYAQAIQPLPDVGVARPSPFPPPMDAGLHGNPSPFAGQRAGYSPIGGAPAIQISGGGWEDDAMTTVMLPGMPPPPSVTPGWQDSLTPASDATISGERFAAGGSWLHNRAAWVGLATAAVIGAAVGARTLLKGEESATVTIVTRPTDAEVVVNGSPLPSSESSPFTVQGLAADTDHAIVVRKTGYAEQTHHFRIEAGEVMSLPAIDLKPLNVDTGFALSSLPEGAEVFVDGAKIAQTTPVRITNLQPGLHVIRLVHERGFQPWETQVALASGQLIELPPARLVAGGSARGESRGESRGRSERASANGGGGSRRSTQERARPRERPAAAQPSVLASSSRFGTAAGFGAAPAAPAAGGGKGGSLRLNSRPWSQVYVDGRMMGNTPLLNVPLSAGSHNLKLVNPQLGMIKHLKVKIQAGKTTTKIVDLVE